MYIMWRRRERLRGAAAQCISLPAIRSVFSVIVIFYGSVFRRFPGGTRTARGAPIAGGEETLSAVLRSARRADTR